jgi:hypothetical protein
MNSVEQSRGRQYSEARRLEIIQAFFSGKQISIGDITNATIANLRISHRMDQRVPKVVGICIRIGYRTPSQVPQVSTSARLTMFDVPFPDYAGYHHEMGNLVEESDARHEKCHPGSNRCLTQSSIPCHRSSPFPYFAHPDSLLASVIVCDPHLPFREL